MCIKWSMFMYVGCVIIICIGKYFFKILLFFFLESIKCVREWRHLGLNAIFKMLLFWFWFVMPSHS